MSSTRTQTLAITAGPTEAALQRIILWRWPALNQRCRVFVWGNLMFPAVFFFPFVQTVFEHCVIYNVCSWNPCRPSLKDLVASSGNRAFCKQCLCLIPVVFCALVKMRLVLSCFLTWIWISAPVRFRLCFFQTKAAFICSLHVEYFHLENWELRTLSYGRPVWELN